ncbi:MAG: tetratricopeptide repeat protein [Candidatus Obscuribacterales bacterium]|nr:tetratricopeptide repeat protein [Candidatus Obscuribacterales bacterium]
MRSAAHFFVSFVLLSLIVFGSRSYAQPADNIGLAEHVNRGNQCMVRRQYQEALHEYEAAKTIDPKNSVVKHNIVECYNNWGIQSYRQNHFEAALGQFQKALAIEPKHAQARYNLNLCRRTMEQTPAADLDQSPSEKAASEPEGKNKTEPKNEVMIAQPQSQPMQGGVAEKKAVFVSGTVMYPTYSTAQSATNIPVQTKVEPVPTPPAKQAVVDEGTIEERLALLEMKVHGVKYADLPVIKRLEKLENETTGHIGEGSISERIQALKRNIGF